MGLSFNILWVLSKWIFHPRFITFLCVWLRHMETQTLGYKDGPGFKKKKKRQLWFPVILVHFSVQGAICLMKLDLLHSGEKPRVTDLVTDLSTGLTVVLGEGTCSELPFQHDL